MKINRKASILVLLVGIASPIRTAPIMAQGDHRGHEAAPPGSIDGAKRPQNPNQVGLLWGAVAATSVAQSEHSGHNPTLHGAPAGAINKDQIPDQVAWRIFFRSVSEPANAGQEEAKRQKAKLASLNLDEADYAKLQTILAAFHGEIERIDSRIVAIGRSSRYSPELEDLRAAINALTTSTRSALDAGLSNRGLAKVRHYVNEVVKANIKSLPIPAGSTDKP